MNQIILPIIVPLITALMVLIVPKKARLARDVIALAGSLINLLITVSLFNKNISYSLPWSGFGMDFSLRMDHFAGFILLAAASFGFLITLYSAVSLSAKDYAKQFVFYLLLNLCLANGAVLSDNLVAMLFFWEGLLITLFGMIAIGSRDAYKTAIKAFVIVGICDLCMMVGIGLTARLSGTLTMSNIHLVFSPLAGLAFILLMIGAISKAGSMPFHTWIPDASVESPLPFMAFLPGALEKLVGIYFLTRISLDMFELSPHSWPSMMLMIIGSVTILAAVMMALIQKDYKKLLSYHAISQVGYMILGIGTALPIGIVGGLFHMINNAMYKSCLFLTAGSVEKETGTTNLEKLGGIGMRMPITFICFFITAVSISGVPPFNGFFSKELLYDAALERGIIFYLAAAGGSFFTALSFLKLGHAAYLGGISEENKNVKEAKWQMLLPMILLAAGCVFFGVYNKFPLGSLIQPVLGARLEGHDFSGFPENMKIVFITVFILALALITHIVSVKIKGKAVKSADFIHYAPVLGGIYGRAEKRFFDPYEIGLKFASIFSWTLWICDRMIDWAYNRFVPGVIDGIGRLLKGQHNGNYSRYLGWSIAGMVLIIIFLMRGL